MVINDLITIAQQELGAHQLEPNVAFKLLYFIYPKIHNLTSYHEHKNEQLYKTSLYKRYLRQYINFQKPLQYITHEAFFYAQNFIVLKRVHIPKVETEMMVDIAKDLLPTHETPAVLDLCCGTGILGVSLALEKDIDLTMVDISRKAIKNSILNAAFRHVNAQVIKSDLFKKVSNQYDLILCNPPYIAHNDPHLEYSVRKYEDKKAIFAAHQGLEFYQRILDEVSHYLKPQGKIIFEIGFQQKEDVLEICRQNSLVKKVKTFQDNNSHDRFIVVYF